MVTMFGHIKLTRKIKVATVLEILLILVIGIFITELCNKYEKQQIVSCVSNDIIDNSISETVLNKEMVVVAYSIVREKPIENSNKICTYNKGDKIKVVSKLSNSWYKVESCKNIGYVKSDSIKSTSEAFVDKDGNVIYSVKADGTIETDGDIDNSLLNYAYNYWYIIPENVRNDFRENGWRIVITDKSLSSELDIGYEISGATIPSDKTIMIYGSQSCIRYALVHEMGHYIDFRYDFISKSNDFKKRYLENGNKMLNYNSNYIQASFSEEEYFAELYRAYLIGDYKIKFMFSDDIDFVSNIGNSIGTVCNDNAA